MIFVILRMYRTGSALVGIIMSPYYLSGKQKQTNHVDNNKTHGSLHHLLTTDALN